MAPGHVRLAMHPQCTARPKKLNKRAANLLQNLLKGHPANSNGVAGASLELDQTANQGAWRFLYLDNKHLKLPAQYQPVHSEFQQRIAVGQRAYILHDVSVVNNSPQDRKEDLCIIRDCRIYGYELLSSQILDSSGKPLVVLARSCGRRTACFHCSQQNNCPT